jgi:hypothetical protein
MDKKGFAAASGEPGALQMRHVPSDLWCWFSDAAVQRAVPCNGGPDDSMYVAVMPGDWPDEAGEFTDEANIWFLHEQA